MQRADSQGKRLAELALIHRRPVTFDRFEPETSLAVVSVRPPRVRHVFVRPETPVIIGRKRRSYSIHPLSSSRSARATIVVAARSALFRPPPAPLEHRPLGCSVADAFVDVVVGALLRRPRCTLVASGTCRHVRTMWQKSR